MSGRARLAAKHRPRAVAPVYYKVSKGEMIVREGERVDVSARQKLETQARQANSRDWLERAGGYFLLTVVIVLITAFVAVKVSRGLRLSDRDVAFLGTLLLIGMIFSFAFGQVGEAATRAWADADKATFLYLNPAAAGGMLAAIFIGPMAGVIFAVVASALAGLLLDNSLAFFVYAFIGSIVGVSGVVRVRERGGGHKVRSSG